MYKLAALGGKYEKKEKRFCKSYFCRNCSKPVNIQYLPPPLLFRMHHVILVKHTCLVTFEH